MHGATKTDIRKVLVLTWLLSFFSIPLFSFYGRPLQLHIMERFSLEELSLWLGLFFGTVLTVMLLALLKAPKSPYVYHFTWVVPLVILLYFSLPFVEKIHIVLFGLFGFLTQKLFCKKTAAVFCVAISFLDELLQHFLSDRVGDWRDVGLNVFSAFLGMLLALILSGAEHRSPEEDSAQC